MVIDSAALPRVNGVRYFQQFPDNTMKRLRSTLAVLFPLLLLAAIPIQAADRPQPVLMKPPVYASVPPKTEARPSRGEDEYLFGETRISLTRSTTECVVRFRSGGVIEPAQWLAGAAPAARIVTEVLIEGRAFHLVEIPFVEGSSAVPSLLENLRTSPEIEHVADVFREPGGKRLMPTDEIVVKTKPGLTREQAGDIAAEFGFRVDRSLWRQPDELVFRAVDGKNTDILQAARDLRDTGRFLWVEPNFIREYERFAAPNDPRFPQQWHLNNTGQSGGTAGADVKAPAAWDTHTGNPAITIAVVDDGVERTHEDLAANIFVNPGEIAGNGIDDDFNGFVDDVSGWDFYSGDNNPDPSGVNENHGTAVAGVAAARGNNSVGVTGACQLCKILPVKIFSPGYAGDTAAANALRYAASFADIVNNSWGGGSPSATLQSAIQTGRNNGRGGRGSAILFATGNSASGLFLVYSPALAAGTHRFRWTYSKDFSIHAGEDAAWVAWTLFPGGELVNFQGGSLPSGFTTGGTSSWSLVTDPRHTDESLCYTRSAKSGALTHSQSNYIQAVKSLPGGYFYSYVWVSSEQGYDGLKVEIDLNNDGSVDLATSLLSGVPYVDLGVAYPAAYPESIAVGASSNNDCRSYYSQYGPQVAFVAPSNAGALNLAIETTDRMGASGYDAGNYTQAAGASGFGGTSSATPLASGVAGLVLSRNPSLTVAQLLSAMQSTATKVGPEPYVGGRNDRYGYGRLHAQQALLSVTSCATLTIGPFVLPRAAQNSVYIASFASSGGAGGYTYSVPVGSLPAGLSLSSGGVLSGTPTVQGTFSFTVRSLDANGCMGYRPLFLVVGPPIPAPTGTSLYLVTPCRVIDTRDAVGPYGGPALPNNSTRILQVTGTCGIPSSAKAVAANITAVAPATSGLLALFPSDAGWPGNSTINYRTARTRANNAIIRLSSLGQLTVYNNGSTQHFIIDVTGYFQ